jgi:Ca2+-binding RTX toxin-like protein
MNLWNLFARRGNLKKRNGYTPRRLRAECLEDRQMCAVAAASFDAATGVLTIQGTAGNDYAGVNYDPVMQKGWVSLGGADAPQVKPNPTFLFKGNLKQINFFGNDGNDTFVNNTSVACFADGGAGDDTLFGGAAADILFGGSGNDRLYGRGGNDTLHGDAGTDFLDGGDGNDVLVGGHDGCKDVCHGGAGHDTFFQYYGPNGTYPQFFDDYQAGEDTILLLAEPGWWNAPNKQNKIPQNGGSGNGPLL